jgi:hypothetical protein
MGLNLNRTIGRTYLENRIAGTEIGVVGKNVGDAYGGARACIGHRHAGVDVGVIFLNPRQVRELSQSRA